MPHTSASSTNVIHVAGIVIFAALLGQSTPALSDDTWTPMAMTNNGDVYFTNLAALKKIGNPPSLVSGEFVHLSNGKGSPRWTWEFSCNDQQVKPHFGQYIDISRETGTMRRGLLDGLCGYKEYDGSWFLAHAEITDTPKKEVTRYWFFDASTIRRNDEIFEDGITLRMRTGSIPVNQSPDYFNVGAGDAHFSCSIDRVQMGLSPIDFAKTSYFSKFRDFICRGYFPINAPVQAAHSIQKVEKIEAGPEAETMESAKTKCAELGFKRGTEKFGACVLKVMK